MTKWLRSAALAVLLVALAVPTWAAYPNAFNPSRLTSSTPISQTPTHWNALETAICDALGISPCTTSFSAAWVLKATDATTTPTASKVPLAAATGKIDQGWVASHMAEGDRGTSQTLPAGAATDLGFDAETFDTDAYHDLVTLNNRFTVPSGQAGTYLVMLNLRVGGTATQQGLAALMKNGTGYAWEHFTIYDYGGGNVFGYVSISAVWSLGVGDYVHAQLLNKGANDMTISSSCRLTVVRIA